MDDFLNPWTFFDPSASIGNSTVSADLLIVSCSRFEIIKPFFLLPGEIREESRDIDGDFRNQPHNGSGTTTVKPLRGLHQ